MIGDTFALMLPIFATVASIAYAVLCIKDQKWKELFSGGIVAIILIVVCMYLAELI